MRQMRRFSRQAKLESRTFCRCELCRLRFGRLFETKREFPYRLRTNLRLGWVNHAGRRRWQHS